MPATLLSSKMKHERKLKRSRCNCSRDSEGKENKVTLHNNTGKKYTSTNNHTQLVNGCSVMLTPLNKIKPHFEKEVRPNSCLSKQSRKDYPKPTNKKRKKNIGKDAASANFSSRSCTQPVIKRCLVYITPLPKKIIETHLELASKPLPRTITENRSADVRASLKEKLRPSKVQNGSNNEFLKELSLDKVNLEIVPTVQNIQKTKINKKEEVIKENKGKVHAPNSFIKDKSIKTFHTDTERLCKTKFKNLSPSVRKHKISKNEKLPKICSNVEPNKMKSSIPHNEHKLVKRPLVDRTNIKTEILKLRKRKTMNYAESSLELSADVLKTVPHKGPIYKQHLDSEVKSKKQEDTYEFDSDSETRKKRKRRKLNKNSSSSDEYENAIKNVLKNVAMKIKKKKNVLLPSYKNNNKKKLIQTTATPGKKKTFVNITSELTKNESAKSITLPQVPEENDIHVDQDDDNVDDDFHTNEASNVNVPKIKIIHNIRLSPNRELNLTVASPTKFKEYPVDTRSTMVNVLKPWRFNNINIIRNPHFITLKESSLPCIHQEMVLDHTIVDKFEDTSRTESAKTPCRETPQNPENKKVIQQIMTDFFYSSDGEDKENASENTELSLFDDNQFSPIKNKSQFKNKVDSVRRKILSELNDNKIYASTPKQTGSALHLSELEATNDSRHVQNSNKNITYFGFNSVEEENTKENTSKKHKPFRLNINVNDKKYTKQKVQKTEKTEPVVLNDADSESDTSYTEVPSGEIRLFEDFSPTRDEDGFEETKFVKKQKMAKWMVDKDQKHKKRKDVRTKSEEEKAEKWAAAFNSMCDEIEEFPLEIE